MKTTETKLPKAFKRKWIAALRSGKYEKGKYNLFDRRSNSYCCLGVACRVAGQKKITDDGSIPVQNRLVPRLLRGVEGVPNTLAAMNDGSFNSNPKSFEEIADWIEENL